MSTRRVFGIAVFGVLLIAAAIAIMQLTSFMRRDSGAIQLPGTSVSSDRPNGTEPDALDRVEVNIDTIRDVVSSLTRPESFRREVLVESFWEGGESSNNISVSVLGGMTSLRILPQVGVEKRIIVTPDTEYIWFRGDRVPFMRNVNSSTNDYRAADEYQMLLTFEDILSLNSEDIIDAGYDGEDSIYAVYRSQLLGHTRTYYISLSLRLIVAAAEHDASGSLIYRMTAFEIHVGEVDPTAFVLPDGIDLLDRVQAIEDN